MTIETRTTEETMHEHRLGRVGAMAARAHARMSALSAPRLREDDGGQHAEEGALIGTLLALGAGAVAVMPDVGNAIGNAWKAAFGG